MAKKKKSKTEVALQEPVDVEKTDELQEPIDVEKTDETPPYQSIKSVYPLIENSVQRFIDERVSGVIHAPLISAIVKNETPNLEDLEKRISKIEFSGMSISEILDRTQKFLADIKASIE